MAIYPHIDNRLNSNLHTPSFIKVSNVLNALRYSFKEESYYVNGYEYTLLNK